MIIDAHAHIGPWALPGLEILSSTLNDAVEVALREGIGGMAVTRSDAGSNETLRRQIAEEHRLQLWYLPWIRPETSDAEDALGVDGPRVAALKIHPSLDRTPPSSPAYDAAFEAAGEADIPVLVHTGRWQEIAGFELVLERARRHRTTRIILAHAGGNEFGLRKRCSERIIELGLDNVWLDLTGLGMPIFTRSLVERLGAERFLFGSDFPLGHPRVQLAHITAMLLPDAQERAILGETALELLGPPSNIVGDGRA